LGGQAQASAGRCMATRIFLAMASLLMSESRRSGAGTVRPRPLEVEADVAIVEHAEAVVGQRGAQDVAAQPFTTGLVVGSHASSAL
jgi:hypothetical protein